MASFRQSFGMVEFSHPNPFEACTGTESSSFFSITSAREAEGLEYETLKATCILAATSLVISIAVEIRSAQCKIAASSLVR